MHKASITATTQFKERLAKIGHPHFSRCYGKRCAKHHNNWYAWTEGTAK